MKGKPPKALIKISEKTLRLWSRGPYAILKNGSHTHKQFLKFCWHLQKSYQKWKIRARNVAPTSMSKTLGSVPSLASKHINNSTQKENSSKSDNMQYKNYKQREEKWVRRTLRSKNVNWWACISILKEGITEGPSWITSDRLTGVSAWGGGFSGFWRATDR